MALQESSASSTAGSSQDRQISPSVYASPTKKLKITFKDSDSFYEDMRTMFVEKKEQVKLRDFLTKVLEPVNIFPLIDKRELLRAVLDVVDHRPNRTAVVVEVVQLLVTIAQQEEDKMKKLEQGGDGEQEYEWSISDSMVSSLLERYIECLDAKKLFEILKCDDISIDTIFVLVRTVLKKLPKGAARRVFRKF